MVAGHIEDTMFAVFKSKTNLKVFTRRLQN